MKLSEKGIKHLSSWEGCRLFPYDDKTGRKTPYWLPSATIGVGHLIYENEWDKFKDGITEKYAENLLSKDIEYFENVINKKIEVDINQNQFDALVILCFNIGASGFVNSSVRKLINDPGANTQYDNLESAWKAWNKSGGKIVNGLINRRENEWRLYNELFK